MLRSAESMGCSSGGGRGAEGSAGAGTIEPLRGGGLLVLAVVLAPRSTLAERSTAVELVEDDTVSRL